MGTINFDLNRILFLDIETATTTASFNDLSEIMQKEWIKKSKSIRKSIGEDEVEPDELYAARAGIYAEFSRIICISIACIDNKSENAAIRIRSLTGETEEDVLMQFKGLVEKHYNNPKTHAFCGHNIKEFDIPFICRRMTILGIEIPRPLQLSGFKPWQTSHLLDTLHLWRFGDYKNYTSLSLLASVLGIPSPKDDINGSDVGSVYWEENDINRIAKYCEKDVITVIQVFLKLKGHLPIRQENIEIIT